MFHPSTFDGYIGAASITAVAAVYVGRRQTKTKDAVMDSKEILVAMREDMVDMRRAFTSHTADDAANFRQLRDDMNGRRRRRGWLMPALGVLIHLILK